MVVDDGRRRAPGRGAYLCPAIDCWIRGLKGALGASLRTTITEADREALTAHAQRFIHDAPAAPTPAGTEREGDA